MITNKQLEAEARKHGATIDWAPGDTVYYADCPPGKCWDTSTCHVICAPYDDGASQAVARAFLLDEMQQGTCDCDCEECIEE